MNINDIKRILREKHDPRNTKRDIPGYVLWRDTMTSTIHVQPQGYTSNKAAQVMADSYWMDLHTAIIGGACFSITRSGTVIHVEEA